MDNNLKKTLFISDLDGTLFKSDATVSEFTAVTLNRLMEKGLVFSYATARSNMTAGVITGVLNINVPVIAYNGTVIQEHRTQTRYMTKTFSDTDAEYIFKTYEKHGAHPLVYSFIDNAEKFMYCRDRISHETAEFIKNRKGDGREMPVEYEDVLTGDVFHFACMDREERLYPAYLDIKDKFYSVYYVDMYSGHRWLEIMPPGASKANAVLELKKMLGCDRIVSFGDGKNDIPMFEISDECYAVENAHPLLKEIATGIIGSNDSDGVAKWLAERC